jgi:hypothetical protein
MVHFALLMNIHQLANSVSPVNPCVGSIMRHAFTTVVSMQVPYGSLEPRNESMNDRALPSVVCPRAVTFMSWRQPPLSADTP